MHTACVWSVKLPFAEYSVVKEPTFALRASVGKPPSGDLQKLLGLPTVAPNGSEGWWRIPGSNR
jgi:hypothetical protein